MMTSHVSIIASSDLCLGNGLKYSGLYCNFLLQGTRMEERLDDAINVLRNHAENQAASLHPLASSTTPGLLPQSHSNGIMGYHPALEPHLVCMMLIELIIN